MRKRLPSARHHHPADVLLRPYVEGRPPDSDFPEAAEAVEIAQNDLRSHVDSIPPPSALSDTRGRVMARMKSGSWEIEVLERELRASVERAAAEKLAALAARLAEEVETRKGLQGTIKEIRDGQRKFWFTVLAGVMIGLIVAAVAWTTTELVTRSAPPALPAAPAR